MSQANAARRITRVAKLEWVPISMMRVSAQSQREQKRAFVEHIVAEFDVDQLGNPTVSKRGGWYHIMDGQHRIGALREMGWGDQLIQCWVYEGLTEAEEAEKFLQLNDTLTPTAFAKFRIGVQAQREEECAIDGVVRAAGLVVSQDKIPGAIAAVGTLRRVYSRTDAATLSRTLGIIRDAYGDPGMEAAVIDGIGYLCGRYNGELDTPVAVERLGRVHGGVNGLLGEAEKLRLGTGNAKGQCVAAAAVTIINRARGGKKLPSWWGVETDPKP